MSATNITKIHALYASAPKEMHRFEPSELGVPRVGHFGFFKPKMSQLWESQLLGELVRA